MTPQPPRPDAIAVVPLPTRIPPSPPLPCHRRGYDLRVHPPDTRCPECNATVADAIALAAIPIRPAYRNSDPRCRRRILAGLWILTLLPLLATLNALDWLSQIPMPAPNVLR